MDMQAISLYLCLIKAVVHDQSFFTFGVAKKGDTRKLRLTQQSISLDIFMASMMVQNSNSACHYIIKLQLF